MSASTRFAAVLVAFVAASLAPSALVSAKELSATAALDESWKWVVNERFEVLTNGPDRRAREMLEQLESYRAALAQITGGQVAESPTPIRVVLFDRVWDMAPFQLRRADGTPERFSGYFLRRGDLGYIVLANEWGDDVPRVVFHEYAHYLVSHHLGRLPSWLNEGLAEYFGAFRYLERARRVEIGRPIAEHMRLLNTAPHYPLAQLVETDYASPDFAREMSRHLFYSKSWLLVHYLQIGSPERAGALARFAGLYAAGMSAAAALEKAAGCSLRELDDELLAYQRKSLVRFGSFDLARDARWSNATVRPASREEAAFRLGELLRALDPGREADTRALFAASGRPEPKIDTVYAAHVPDAVATVDLTPPSLDELRQFLAANPDSTQALADFAVTVYRQEVGRTPPDTALLAEARAALLRAAELAPGERRHAADLLLLLRIDSSVDDVAASLETIAAAVAAYPDDHDLRVGYSALLVRAGELDRAYEVAQEGLARAGNHYAAEEFRRLLGQLDADRAVQLARDGRPAEAEAVLVARLAVTPDISSRLELERTLESIRSSGRHNQARAVYQQAVDLTKAGDYEGAVRILRELIASQPPPAVDDVARKALAQLEPIVESLRKRRGASSSPPS